MHWKFSCWATRATGNQTGQEKLQKGKPRCTGNCQHRKMHQPYSISSPSRTNLEYCTIQTGKQEWAPHKNLLSSSEFESFETGLNTNLLSVHRLVRSNMYRIAMASLHAIGMWSTDWMSPASIPQDRKMVRRGRESGIWARATRKPSGCFMKLRILTCYIPDAVGNPSSPDCHRLVHEIQARHLQAVLLLPVIPHILNLQTNEHPHGD